jgi:NADPH:quinone reductase-like Zn-dependent oxidoreductase
MTNENFIQEIEEMSRRLGATTMFDTLGGKIPSEIFGVMPQNSMMVSLGNLNNQPVAFSSNDLRWKNKIIKGFMIPRFLKRLSEEER